MSRRIANQQSRLGLEKLEQRELMAGNVKVAVDAGDLVITGDTSANEIYVRQVGTDRFAISGVNTKINGSSGGTRYFNGVFDDVRIVMNGGNDRVVVNGKTPDSLIFSGGAGNDYLKVEDVIAADVAITTGSGRDKVVINRTQTEDDLTINGNSHNAGDFDEIYVLNSTIGTKYVGTLNIDLNNGNDKVYIDNVVADELYAYLYKGDDYLSIKKTTIRNDWLLNGGDGTDGLNRYANSATFGSTNFNRYTYNA